MIENKMDSIVINDISYDLKGVEYLVWKLLVTGAAKSKDGFHTLCVGTVNKDGEASLRTVVHRKTNELEKKIFFHTDTRSRKIEDLTNDSRVSLLFYDAHRRMQLTMKATTTLHQGDALAAERWKATNAQSRRCYMTIEAPNTKAELPTVGYDERYLRTEPSEAESDIFKENFMVVECNIHQLEFLFLQHTGNKKAVFTYKNGALIDNFWAVP